MTKSLCTMILFLSLSSPAFAQSDRIAAIHLEGLERLNENLVRDVLPFHVGDSLDMKRIDQAVDILRHWGVFDAIQVHVDTTPEGMVVVFHLDEAKIVSAIDISGNYPYVENRIRKYLTLNPGDIVTPDVIKEQTDRILSFYARQGYFNTQVNIHQKERPEVGGMDLTFHIDRGDVFRIRSIHVEGNHAIPQGRFVSTINPLRMYSEQRLKTSLRTLTNFYHTHGYPEAKIRLVDTNIDYNLRRVDLRLEVHEGPHVRVTFKGNYHVSNRTLKRTVTIFREGNIDADEIDVSVVAIRDALSRRGFPESRVTMEEKTLPDGTMVITFDLDEGKQQTIKHIRFSGNHHVNSKRLKENMMNHESETGRPGRFLPDMILSDTTTLTTTMGHQGFLDATVGEWEMKPTSDGFASTITIPIDEGERTVVSHVDIIGNASSTEKQLLKALQLTPGKPYNPEAFEEDRQRLLVFYADHGHPYAEVRQSANVDRPSHAARIRYEIEEGTAVTIGRILIVGDIETSQKAIKKAMSIHEGELFSYRKILESQLNIRRLGPFSSVTVETIGVTEKESVVHLKVKVDEQPPFLVDVEAGYSTDDQYSGSLRFTNLNAFGWAKRNTLSLTAGPEFSRFDLGWLDPRFLGTNFQFLINNWVQYKQDPAFTFIQLGGAIGWLRRFERLSYLLRQEVDQNHFLEGSTAAADAQSLRDNTISKTTVSTSYDSRDNFSDPRRGILSTLGADVFNEIRGNEAHFVKVLLANEVDVSPLRWITMSSAVRFNRIVTVGNHISVPSNELLFLGGDDTVRGFTEDHIGPLDVNGNPTGGRFRWIFNQEIRWRMTHSFQTAAFYDLGQLADTISNFSFQEARQSAGLGLRYITPVGPIRLDYGFKLDRRPGEPQGRLHITFGYFF